MQLDASEHNLKLVYPFAISRHTYHSQPNVVIELRHRGISGFGEATVNPYYKITIDNLKSSFYEMRDRLRSYDFTTPNQLFEDFSDFLDRNAFALAALNNASWDLYGKLRNKPVKDLINLKPREQPKTSYTLGIDADEKMLAKMRDKPWPIYKIKLGTQRDLELVQLMRANTDSLIRVDANCAWDVEKTVMISSKLKSLGVEFIEQPLAHNHPGQPECFSRSALPLMADESCCVASDVEKCIGGFHAINIKLLKCGGISPALKMIEIARSNNLKIMVGCMTESSIGIAAAAQLLPFVDYADLDGPLLLDEDLAVGLSFSKGEISISGELGLGIEVIGKNDNW